MLNFTYAIIAITVITTIIGFQNRALYDKCTFSVKEILKHNAYYRLITANFIHVDFTHLLFNMFSLFSFSINLEKTFGYWLIIVIYFCSAIGGDLLSLFLKRNEPDYRAVGASGAVCGIIFSSVFLLPGGSIYILPIPIPIPAWVYAILFILISLYGIGRGGSMIGHEAHVGGALIGIICAVIYNPKIIYTEYIILCLLTIPIIVLLILSFKRPDFLYNRR